MVYGKPPIIIDEYQIDVSEMMYYQYYPVMVPSKPMVLSIESRLNVFADIIGHCIIHEKHKFGNDFKYAYVSAKNIFCPTGSNINRPGWHSDGFLSDDVNYIWSNTLPTEFIVGHWLLGEQIPEDHEKSLKVFEDLASESDILTCDENVLYRLDQSVIHRPAINHGPAMLRCFLKVSLSNDVYNLKGNSVNYSLPSIDYKERDFDRNHPSKNRKP